MISPEAITEFANGLAREYHPEKIILFGSQACGKPRPDSDVDMLVVMAFEGNSLRNAAAMVRKLNPPFAVDLLLRTPEQMRQRLEWNDLFLKEIVEEGVVLYAAADG